MLALKSQAIQTALVGDWSTAISLNQEILQEEPDDIDTLNRLAFAFLSSGDPKEAKTVYEKVLDLDLRNPIALRNLKRLNDPQMKRVNTPINNFFIEEPGKTKVIELLNVADKKIIAPLRSGEKLELRIKRNRIFALDSDGQFLGMLPDDICQRLIKFMTHGNEYTAYVRTVDNIKISIFIREEKRAKRFKDEPSFVSNEKAKLNIDNNSPKASKGNKADAETSDDDQEETSEE